MGGKRENGEKLVAGSDPRLLLRQTALFRGLDDAHVAELVSKGRRRSMDAGQVVFMENDRADGFYVVLRGRVKVFKLSPKGREQTLMIMGPGEPVGEVAVFAGGAYPASAESLESGELLYVPRQAFLDLVGREPEAAMRMLSALSRRLRAFASLIEYLSLREVAERLAAHLLSLAAEGGMEASVDLGVTRNQLSAAMGTVPETLSRAFQQLTQAGAVRAEGRRVHIRDRAVLARVAGIR